jgi:hypothetical protein
LAEAEEGRDPLEESDPTMVIAYMQQILSDKSNEEIRKWLRDNAIDAETGELNFAPKDIFSYMSQLRAREEDPNLDAGLRVLDIYYQTKMEGKSPEDAANLVLEYIRARDNLIKGYENVGEKTKETAVDMARSQLSEEIRANFDKILTEKQTSDYFGNMLNKNDLEKFVEASEMGAYIGRENEILSEYSETMDYIKYQIESRFNRYGPSENNVHRIVNDLGLYPIIEDEGGEFWEPYISRNKIEFRRWNPNDLRRAWTNVYDLPDGPRVGFNLQDQQWMEFDLTAFTWVPYKGTFEVDPDTGRRVPSGISDLQIDRAQQRMETRKEIIDEIIKQSIERQKEEGLYLSE